ncbi:MAG: TetR/AcrR family transcriptional regulator [Halomonadaceae bacterium]|uniref:TetR/AcrR family transcriptional regulator n=1 Tax=Halomonas TaxID=2745 RepID=UPI001CE45682|nr:TetR/AcrR family transcriptional regulator [Halomonas colorata]
MTTLTASRLQDAALARFAKQGFDATSMNEIAADVGIKKPSVYAHFRNKEELFLSLIPLVIEAEQEYAKSTLRGGDDMKQQLLAYLQGIEERFNSSYRVQFWVRILLAPPVHLYDMVMDPMHIFMDDLERILKNALQASPLVPNASQLSADVLAMTCMSMIDSLQSELLFGGAKKYQRRLESTWAVFEAAIASPSDGNADN